jgi:NAD(P)-dependent dehydrogenase (short-subunit alcohol dehydrogenase family)
VKQSVVVTGGSKGIGWDIVQTLSKAGYHVFSGSRSIRQNISEEFRDSITQVQIDTKVEEDHLKLAKSANKDGFQLVAYINNAGYSKWKAIDEINESFLDDIIRTNLIGYFWGAKAASSQLTAGGSLINISSIAGKRGSANNSAYVATKFGVTGLTQSLSKELGAKGIRVNAVCPVLVKSEGLLQALAEPSSPANGDAESFLSNFANTQSSLKRLPSGREVADLVLYLIGDKASAITGQSIHVDCGVLPN